MGILGKKILFETIRSIDSATFTGSYQALGTPITNSAVLIKIVNNSTVDVTLSITSAGTTDQDFLSTKTAAVYDFGTNAQSVSKDERLSLSANTQVYIKGTAGVGSVYLIAIYQGG